MDVCCNMPQNLPYQMSKRFDSPTAFWTILCVLKTNLLHQGHDIFIIIIFEINNAPSASFVVGIFYFRFACLSFLLWIIWYICYVSFCLSFAGGSIMNSIRAFCRKSSMTTCVAPKVRTYDINRYEDDGYFTELSGVSEVWTWRYMFSQGYSLYFLSFLLI